jgi:hypothetical protein
VQNIRVAAATDHADALGEGRRSATNRLIALASPLNRFHA